MIHVFFILLTLMWIITILICIILTIMLIIILITFRYLISEFTQLISLSPELPLMIAIINHYLLPFLRYHLRLMILAFHQIRTIWTKMRFDTTSFWWVQWGSSWLRGFAAIVLLLLMNLINTITIKLRQRQPPLSSTIYLRLEQLPPRRQVILRRHQLQQLLPVLLLLHVLRISVEKLLQMLLP